jgi:hypothetical protein
MNLVVVKLFEHNFTVGKAVAALSWAHAYEIAKEFIWDEIAVRNVNFSHDYKRLLEIDKALELNNYYCIDFGGEKGKAVAVQIIATE